jgi:integrase/recombinase XerD
MSGTWRSRLGRQIAGYVALKKALGRRFRDETYVFVQFDRFLAKRRAPALTPGLFAAWVRTFAHVSPTVRRTRMRIVRNFCLYLRRTDRTCFVPDPSGFPAPHVLRRPHIFTREQIVKLLRVATKLPARSTSLLRAQVFRLAIVLLYTAGLRRGELVRLVMSDYDPAERTLLVRASKFHKSRLVALSRSAADEMERYLRARRRLPHHADAPLLVSNHHGPRAYSGGSFGLAMRSLFRVADTRASDGRLPRVHDLRHTFAVHALLRWYRQGVDVQTKLPALAIAMGHVSVASTAYYLALLTPVAAEASGRFERHCRCLFTASRTMR